MTQTEKKSEETKRKVRSNTDLTETDLAQDKMGRNALQGDDQLSVRNERKAVPHVKQETDSIIESLEKTDKDVRAERDLGKGNRSSNKTSQSDNT